MATFLPGEPVVWIDAMQNTRTGWVVDGDGEFTDEDGDRRVRLFCPPIPGANSPGYKTAPHVARVGRPPFPVPDNAAPLMTAEAARATGKQFYWAPNPAPAEPVGRPHVCYIRGLNMADVLVVMAENPVRAAEFYVAAMMRRREFPITVLVRQCTESRTPGVTIGVSPFGTEVAEELEYRVRYTPGESPLITHVERK